MRVSHGLIFFFFLTALRDGSTDLHVTDIGVRTGTEGGQITVKCNFKSIGRRKVFCRDACEGGDILVETSGDRNQSGRYSIEYEKRNYLGSPAWIYVSITNLRKSDSGRYRCFLDRGLSSDSAQMFELQVKDAPTTTKPNWTLKPFSTPALSAFIVTTTPPAPSASDSLLLVRLVVVIVVIVSSSAVLTFCWRKRTSKPEDPHVELDHVNVTEGDQVYEEFGEDERRGRSPPEETSDL